MNKLSTFVLFCTIASFLAGCAGSRYNFQNRDKSYMNAKSIQPTRIPPGLASNGFQSYYPVSLQTYPASAQHISIVPPGLTGSA